VIVALKMLFTGKKSHEEREKSDPESYRTWICIGIGTLSGAIAAFSGLGGGVFVIPLMHYLMKVPFKKAIGTSSAAILITAAAGVLSYFINMPAGSVNIPYAFGMVDTISCIPVIAASIPAARLGVYLNKRTHHYLLTKLFAVFILAVCIKLIFF
ncbi:MAG TPA: sulfite exporter TauE/SafE family protein, partial [Ignavibacteria bacterium]|nr:sulfite exporter TauE/SafE family protein [Ignavibacteria bacterium]